MKKNLLLLLSVLTISSVSAQTTWGVKAGMNSSMTSIGIKDLSLKINPGNKIGFYVGAVNNIELGSKFGLQTELLYNYGGFRMAVGDDVMSGISGLLNEMGGFDEELKLNNISLAMNSHSLQLPILVTYNILDNLSVMAGPYLSFRIGNSGGLNDDFGDVIGDGMEIPAEDMNKAIDEAMDMINDLYSDNINSFDIGASLGAEYRFNNGLFVDFRYTFSFMNKIKPDFDSSSIYPEDEDTNSNYEDELGITPRAKSSAIQFGLGYRF